MANRSYIYALKDGKHTSLGEFNYFIPYAYRVLAAYDNRSAESHIWDAQVAIEADFKKGRAALYRLLDILAATGEMKNHAAFVEAVRKTKEYLDPIDADTTLLENGEIYFLYQDEDGNSLDKAALERTALHNAEDYQWNGEDVDNLVEYNLDPAKLFHYEDESYREVFKWILNLKDNWEEELGLDSWRSVLYFQFGDSTTGS